MSKKTVLAAASAAFLLGLAPTAWAITFGQPDGERHPNVGAMIVQEPDGLKYVYCSGVLIAPQVFLTAAHCTASAAAAGADPHNVFVTFDNVLGDSQTLLRGTYKLNPGFGHDRHNLNDVAVILLDEAVTDITPAKLPPAGLLDAMKDDSLREEMFTTVGYGAIRDDKTGGPHALGDYGERQFAEQSVLALKPYWLQLSMNPATGNGGTCYGDSGGPHFLSDTDTVVSLTVTGDMWCRATDVTYRLDTEAARSYLAQFLNLE